jgi:lipopolysaccharide export system ATP-binding protein
MNLRADNLVKKYKQRAVVSDVSFNVSQGEIVGLLGPNGAGKTTSFYMIVGLIKPNEGKIFLDDEDITFVSYLLRIISKRCWKWAI